MPLNKYNYFFLKELGKVGSPPLIHEAVEEKPQLEHQKKALAVVSCIARSGFLKRGIVCVINSPMYLALKLDGSKFKLYLLSAASYLQLNNCRHA